MGTQRGDGHSKKEPLKEENCEPSSGKLNFGALDSAGHEEGGNW